MRPKTRNHAKRANKKRNAKSYAKGNTTEKTQKQITKKTKQCETNYRSKHAICQKKEHQNANQN